jgi:hypothetical protein
VFKGVFSPSQYPSGLSLGERVFALKFIKSLFIEGYEGLKIVAQFAGFAVLPVVLTTMVDLIFITDFGRFFIERSMGYVYIVTGVYSCLCCFALIGKTERRGASANQPVGIRVDILGGWLFVNFSVACFVLGGLESRRTGNYIYFEQAYLTSLYLMLLLGITFAFRFIFSRSENEVLLEVARLVLVTWGVVFLIVGVGV